MFNNGVLMLSCLYFSNVVAGKKDLNENKDLHPKLPLACNDSVHGCSTDGDFLSHSAFNFLFVIVFVLAGHCIGEVIDDGYAGCSEESLGVPHDVSPCDEPSDDGMLLLCILNYLVTRHAYLKC